MTQSNPLERIVGRHTRGPWELMPEEPDKPYLRIRGTVVGGRFKIANVLAPVYANVPPWEAEETLANARLIAAAPELLDALQWTARALHHEHPAAVKARATIAKALGVPPNAALRGCDTKE